MNEQYSKSHYKLKDRVTVKTEQYVYQYYLMSYEIEKLESGKNYSYLSQKQSDRGD